MNQQVVWEDIHSKFAWSSVTTLEFLAFMAEYYWGKSGLKFLDLGAGGGSNTLWLANRGFKVTAVEFSKSACDRIWKALPENDKPLVTIINSDVMEVDFKTKFDCILMVGFFEHLSLQQSCILGQKLKDWLKSDGRMLAKILAQPVPKELDHWGMNIGHYSYAEVVKIFKYFNGLLSLNTQYGKSELLPVTNWVYCASHKEDERRMLDGNTVIPIECS